MFKETNLSKLIFAVPILFIILTSAIITLIHIKKADDKFKLDSSKLKQNFLDEERLRLNAILESINSYIVFKKATSTNILKDKVKSRVEFADNLLAKLYNNSIGIESKSSIQINLLASLSDMKPDDHGTYFIYGYNKKDDEFLFPTVSKKHGNKLIYSNKDFLRQFNELMKNKNEGFIFYSQEVLKDNKLKELSKLTYIKKFEALNIVLGYTVFLDEFDESTKDEVLNRLDLMTLKNDGCIFTLDDDLTIIQHSKTKHKISQNLKDLQDVQLIENLEEYLKLSKAELSKKSYEHYWQKIDDKTYKLFVFNYIKDWEWLLGLSVNVQNIDKSITKIIGSIEAQRNESISESLQAALGFILIASIISFFISKRINRLFTNYKRRIESQKNALKNINATLASKVEEKTQQLEVLNSKLKDKFKIEVRKNRKKDQILYNQSKMAAMGEMIGNIAHQWRQPLSTISTIASGNNIKIQFDTLDNNELQKDFTKIVDTTKHLSNTIEDFRNFFMENKSIERFDLCDVLDKGLSLISASMQNNYITIVKNFNSVEIDGIKNELLQALLNILNNSRDILIEKEEFNRVIVIDVFKQNENCACIEIKDSGGGVAPELLEKIFEPYFTTKDVNHGTGIGLYMTKEIIVNHMNGKLSVSNEEFVIDDVVYKGASFKISLPI